MATTTLIVKQLATDHRPIAADLRGNRRLRQPRTMQRRELGALRERPTQRQMLAHTRAPTREAEQAPSGGQASYPLCISEVNPRLVKLIRCIVS